MEQRFLSYVEKTDYCWLWTGGKCMGYGIFKINGRSYRSHRVSYQMWVGQIPDNNVIRHKCDNHSCVNPAHLETGTNKQNSEDMVKRNRQAKGSKQGSSKLTEDEVREIKILLGFGITGVELAKRFNTTPANISVINLCKGWKHIT